MIGLVRDAVAAVVGGLLLVAVFAAGVAEGARLAALEHRRAASTDGRGGRR